MRLGVLLASAFFAVACSSSEPTAVSCADYIDAAPNERQALASSAWSATGDAEAELPPLDGAASRCREAPDRLLAPVLESVAAEASAVSTSVTVEPAQDALTIRAVRQVIPVVKEGGGGPSGALAEISADCVAESVPPATVAATPDRRLVVADDEICYRLGPVLFATASIASVVAEGDERVVARRLTVRLAGDDVQRLARLTTDAAASAPVTPTGQVAVLLNGALLDVVLVREPVVDGTLTLNAAGDSYEPAVVTIFEGMAGRS